MKTGIANLPLHYGTAPKWLFTRMVKLAQAITEVIVEEYGTEVLLKRISQPHWFQSFGCVLGYDWHSSGLTTVTCGALKEALNKANLGIMVAGGKGKTSIKTPQEIKKISETFSFTTTKTNRFIYASRMCAKVDNALIQDNYQLYHHTFFLTEKGKWAVIQQGMFKFYARRYHWLSDNIKHFVVEPHEAICCDKKLKHVLNMTAKESEEARKTSLDIVKENPNHIIKYFREEQKTLYHYDKLSLPSHHRIPKMRKLELLTLKRAYEFQPRTYEELVAIKGVGPKTIRSLALISQLIYGKRPSWEDPVKYSFAHGGKDSIPYPVNKKVMDSSIKILKEAIYQAKLGNKEKLQAIKRLKNIYQNV